MGKNRNHTRKEYIKFYKIKEIPMSKKKMTDEAKITLGCGTIIMMLVMFALALFLTPVFLMLTWNLAVCALFPTLPAMSYWVAFGVNWFLNIIGNKFVNTGINAYLNRISDKLSED